MSSIRSHLSYAKVVSTVSLVLVIGGATAMAATHLGRNSVGTKQLKDNAVTAAKIRDGAVGSGEIGKDAVGGGQLVDGLSPPTRSEPAPSRRRTRSRQGR